ncbi:MAG: glycine--tRNA ligase, partial [Thermoplasmata archaeon]
MMRDEIYSLAKRRGFFYPSSEIYGGLAGFYDYGPLGVRLRDNLIKVWKNYYVLGENFLEIDTPTLTPEEVFIASGHVKEFTDKMVKCTSCGAEYKADDVGSSDLCPACGGLLSEEGDVNLMFSTEVGIKSTRKAYLRPETAQGIFVSFINLYLFNREKMPFGVVQVGRGYRNEISPRQGLIRLREFNMAEAEVFIDPRNKRWDKFQLVCNEVMHLVDDKGQEWEMSAVDAVEKKIIGSEALAYFMVLTKRYLIDVGIDEKKLRFRKHKKEEQAHYAMECWDAEALTSYGWVEIVGIADRGDFDLSMHIKHSDANLRAFRRFEKER